MKKIASALLALLFAACFCVPAQASSSITCNGNTYTWPDQFQGYNYVQQWPLFMNDCLTQQSTYTGNANVSATNASASANNAATSAANAAVSATNAANYAATLNDSSATSLAIATGLQTFTVSSGKQFSAGQFISAVSRANNANYMHGQVSSYSGTTLMVNVTDTGGSGTHSDWNMSVSAPQGPAAVMPSISSGHLIGNATGSSATAGDTSLTGLIDQALGNVQGSLIYRGVSSWTILNPGSSGQYLQTQGPGASPQWVSVTAPALTLISTQTANNTSSSLSWTGLGTTYDSYLLVVKGVYPSSSANITIQIGTGTTPTWKTSGYAYAMTYAVSSSATVNTFNNSGTATGVFLGYNPVMNATGLFGRYQISQIPGGTGTQPGTTLGTSAYTNSSGTWEIDTTAGYVPNLTSAITAIRVIASGANLQGGTVSLYGISN